MKLELACLKAMFNKALLWERAEENPVKKVKMPQVHNTRVRFLEEEEEVVLMSECRGYLSAIVQVALATGFRRAELLSLKPADVYFARGLVSIEAGYAKKGRSALSPDDEHSAGHPRAISGRGERQGRRCNLSQYE